MAYSQKWLNFFMDYFEEDYKTEKIKRLKNHRCHYYYYHLKFIIFLNENFQFISKYLNIIL